MVLACHSIPPWTRSSTASVPWSGTFRRTTCDSVFARAPPLVKERVVVGERPHPPDVEGTGGGRGEAQTDGQIGVSLGRYSGYAWPPKRAETAATNRSVSGSATRDNSATARRGVSGISSS